MPGDNRIYKINAIGRIDSTFGATPIPYVTGLFEGSDIKEVLSRFLVIFEKETGTYPTSLMIDEVY